MWIKSEVNILAKTKFHKNSPPRTLFCCKLCNKYTTDSKQPKLRPHKREAQKNSFRLTFFAGKKTSKNIFKTSSRIPLKNKTSRKIFAKEPALANCEDGITSPSKNCINVIGRTASKPKKLAKSSMENLFLAKILNRKKQIKNGIKQIAIAK